MISASFAGEARGQAIGTWSASSVIVTAGGPVLGGWLAQSFSWRYVFLINLPLAAVVLFVLRKHVVESRDEHAPRSIDVPGATLATLGLGLLIFGLIRLQGKLDGVGVASAIAGSIVLGGFLIVEKRSAQAMMPLRMFDSHRFAAANLYTLLLYTALGGSLFFVPFNLINVQGYSPLAAGCAMLPMVAMIALISPAAGRLAARTGARPLLAWGALIAALGFLAYARIGIGGSYWTTFFPASIILGIGAAGFVAPLTTTVMNSVNVSHAGIASAINNAVARTAGLFAVALLGIVLEGVFYSHFDRAIAHDALSTQSMAVLAHERSTIAAGHVPGGIPLSNYDLVKSRIDESYVRGFDAAMLLSALAAVVAISVALVMLPKGETVELTP
ncbi:MAG: MFS transporter [Candidatus Eremiobacteraeota bacterium]|nr:MFS transporter [Candidatus Eremiobacteraeota bacterium]